MNEEIRSYIVKDSKGNIHFFYFDKEIIFDRNIKILSNSSNNIQPVIENVHSDFFATIDENDVIHLLCQNTNGDIIYLKYVNNIWEKQVILISKNITFYNKFFYILPCSNISHFFFVIKNNGKYLLINQTISNNCKINEPLVIDYINIINSRAFSVDKDENENIFIFYSTKEDNYYKIGYKKLEKSSSKWSNYFEISQLEHNSIPDVLIDRCNNIHLIWLNIRKELSSIVYKRILADDYLKSKFNREVILSCKKSNYQPPFLIMTDENLWAFWNDNQNIYLCLSNDNYLIWNKPIKYRIKISDFKPIFYSTNFPSEKNRILVKNAFCNTENLNIILISEFLQIPTEYLEEIAIAIDNSENNDNFNLYFENIKGYFFKIFDKINSLQYEKEELQRNIDILKTENLNLKQKNDNLKENIENLYLENKKYNLEIQNLNKKIKNTTNLLDDKILQIKELKNINYNLTKQLSEIRGNKNLWLKRLLKFLFK